MGPRSNPMLAQTTNHRDTQNIRAAFQTRKSLADCVKDNMVLADRRTYYQRIIFVAKHLENSSEFNKGLFKFLRQKLTKADHYAHGENISGLILFYDGYSAFMLEGSEEALGPFLRMVSNRQKQIFQDTRVVLTFNNINRRFFKKVVWYSADPPVLLESVPMERLEDIELQCGTVLRKIYNLCKRLNESGLDNSKCTFSDEDRLDASYNKLMPEIALIDALLTTKYLLSVSQLAGMYEAVPQFFSYDSFVWPLPFSYCPTNIFAVDEFEVNLTFQKDPKRKV